MERRTIGWMTLRVLAVAVAMALGVSAACSTPPSAPTVPATQVSTLPTSFEGIWAIQYKVEDCSGFRHCVNFIGNTRTIYLHLARVGDGYDGVVDLGSHVSVSGTVSSDGVLTLTGRRAAALADDYEVEIDSLTLQNVGWSQSNPTGSVRYTTRGASNSNIHSPATTQGPFTAVERTGSLDSVPSTSGTWTGSVAIHTCETTGFTHCSPLAENETFPVTLSLVPGAGGVKGTLKLSGSTIPVSGTGTGSSLRLSGSASPPSSGVTVTLVVEAPALVVDRVGRLTGHVTLVSTYNWHDGRGIWTVRYPPLPLYAVARSLR